MTYCPLETPVWLAGHPQPAACVGGRHSPPCVETPWAGEEHSYREQSQYLGHKSSKIKKKLNWLLWIKIEFFFPEKLISINHDRSFFDNFLRCKILDSYSTFSVFPLVLVAWAPWVRVWV